MTTQKRQSSKSPVDKPSPHRQKLEMSLDFSPDGLNDDTHNRMDQQVLDTTSREPSDLPMATFLLATIVSVSEGYLDRKYEANPNAMQLLREQPALMDVLQETWKSKSFRRVRNLTMLRKHEITRSEDVPMVERSVIVPPIVSQEATIESWKFPYRGNVAGVFYAYLSSHKKSNAYARLVPIVQSSGMGKSRMIDEFSKRYFVIPLNLRSGYEGYPAPDTAVRDWFKDYKYSRVQSDDRFSAYLTALFEETLNIVEDPENKIRKQILAATDLTEGEKDAAMREYPAHLAGQFRLFMTAGQSFDKQGNLRVKFYEEVMERASQLYNRRISSTPKHLKTPGGRFHAESPDDPEITLKNTTSKLLQFLDETAYSEDNNFAVLTLAFDEAHSISVTEMDPETKMNWSKFSSLKRTLRSIRALPVWSVFLSTTGKANQFAPAPLTDSNRIFQGMLTEVPAFSALGFDHLAEKLSTDGSTTLESVASLEYRVSLGRPLWMTRYKSGDDVVRSTITLFAIEKLLCRSYQADLNLASSTDQKLAVLSRRVVLDFDIASCSGPQKQEAEGNQMVQVEKHMRVCLRVREGFESMVTVAASEPILSEAAATVMQHKEFRACRALLNILDWPGMSKGDRGELITSLITILTLDSLAFPEGTFKSFIVSVNSYFQALFAQPADREAVLNAKPSKLRQESENQTFADTFKDARIYLTHFIKIYDHAVLNVKFLVKLISRGAGIVCVNNQNGIDLIIPIVYKGGRLHEWNITVILIQVKNDAKYSTTPKRWLFAAMNPFTLGVFGQGQENPPPVIRMVYALAAREPVVHVMEPPERVALPRTAKSGAEGHRYTSFDIWCGHTSSHVFGAIQHQENDTYRELLKQTKTVPQIFESDYKALEEITMSMYPGGTSRDAHWKSFCELDTTGIDDIMVAELGSSDEGSNGDGEPPVLHSRSRSNRTPRSHLAAKYLSGSAKQPDNLPAITDEAHRDAGRGGTSNSIATKVGRRVTRSRKDDATTQETVPGGSSRMNPPNTNSSTNVPPPSSSRGSTVPQTVLPPRKTAKGKGRAR